MALPFASQPLLPTLPLQIADQIAASIVDGRFAPGSRLREVELSASFEVSRATVREALRLLEQRGLVRIQPQRGAHVTQLSAKELDDLFEVRASLLSTGSRLVAERCSAAEVASLRTQVARLRESVDDLDAYTRLSADLVGALMRMSGNDVLAAYVEDFAQRIGRYVRLGLLSIARRRHSVETWDRLIDAIAARDGEGAALLHRRLALENRSAALDAYRTQFAATAADVRVG